MKDSAWRKNSEKLRVNIFYLPRQRLAATTPRHMKYAIFILTFLLSTAAVAQIDLNKIKNKVTGGKPSAKEVASGLKEALTKGTAKGTDQVSKTDGYFKNPEIKIPFPPEVRQVESTLRKMGMDKQVDEFVLSLNRAAEDAAKEAKPIFVDAIKQMTIEDAWSILKGGRRCRHPVSEQNNFFPVKREIQTDY